LCLWLSGAFDLGLARYDFMLIACIAMQAFLVWSKLETIDELKIVCVFHVLGICLELYKVNHGSWTYPEPALTKFAGVPIFSGFMYASVASYFIQAWRRFRLEFKSFPSWPWLALVGVAIYLNFFLSRAFGDNRWLIVLVVFAIFSRSVVEFKPIEKVRKLPLVLGFFLIGLFVWFAENLCTYLGAWAYPHQKNGWEIVDLGKLSSWCLLVIVSFILVAALKRLGVTHHQTAAIGPEIELT
jgi:uncharacterized membrane protein YoaT (DUF817 family)